MVGKTYKDIVAQSVILNRTEGLTSSGQRRLLSETFKGEKPPTGVTVKIHLTGADIAALAASGYRGFFKEGENFVTVSEIAVFVNKIRPKVEKLKDRRKKQKLAKITNRLMSVFGAGFTKDMGGYISDKPDEGAVPKNKVVKAK